MSVSSSAYYGQFMQDKFLNEQIFKDKKNGIFIEIGAYDGITSSNTYFFEKNLNWHGICIEPVQELYEKIIKNRTAHAIHGCIWHTSGPALFLKVMYPDGRPHELSGLILTYDKRSLKQLEDYWIKDKKYMVEKINTHCFLFNELCKNHAYTFIDYLSIDTEGSELDIIKSIDFKTIKIKVIGVENNYQDPALLNFLKTKGYDFLIRIGVDDFFMQKQDVKKYKKVKRKNKYVL